MFVPDSLTLLSCRKFKPRGIHFPLESEARRPQCLRSFLSRRWPSQRRFSILFSEGFGVSANDSLIAGEICDKIQSRAASPLVLSHLRACRSSSPPLSSLTSFFLFRYVPSGRFHIGRPPGLPSRRGFSLTIPITIVGVVLCISVAFIFTLSKYLLVAIALQGAA